MTMISPCVGTCKLDAHTGYCTGCARTGDEIATWGSASDATRTAIWDMLPIRFRQLGVTCRRLPWDADAIRDYVVGSLQRATGCWTMGVVGAEAQFAASPGAMADITQDAGIITAATQGARLQFRIDQDIRALTFDPPDTPLWRQRIVLVSTRERARLPRATCVTEIQADNFWRSDANTQHRLFDLGLGRREARFCLRYGRGPGCDAVVAATGMSVADAIKHVAPTLQAHSPTRIVETALGWIAVHTPISALNDMSGPGFGPRTRLALDLLATGRATPLGIDLPRAYLPGAIFCPENAMQ